MTGLLLVLRLGFGHGHLAGGDHLDIAFGLESVNEIAWASSLPGP